MDKTGAVTGSVSSPGLHEFSVPFALFSIKVQKYGQFLVNKIKRGWRMEDYV